MLKGLQELFDKVVSYVFMHFETVEPEVSAPLFTEETLQSMTKKELDELAGNQFGIKLDRRRKKEEMIAQFLEQLNAD